MLQSILKPLALAAALAVSAGAAQAFTVSWQNAGDVFGTNGRASVRIDSQANPDVTANVRAGGFALRGNLFGDGVENFTAWCLDIVTTIKNNANYETTNTPFALAPNERILSALQVGRIQSLFDTFYAGLTLSNNTQSAGFQLALWEIVYETGGVLGLGSGNFTATNSAAAIAQANTYLAGLDPAATRAWNLVFLQATPHTSQNLVTVSPVPLPAAAGFLILALGGLAVVARRRTA